MKQTIAQYAQKSPNLLPKDVLSNYCNLVLRFLGLLVAPKYGFKTAYRVPNLHYRSYFWTKTVHAFKHLYSKYRKTIKEIAQKSSFRPFLSQQMLPKRSKITESGLTESEITTVCVTEPQIHAKKRFHFPLGMYLWWRELIFRTLLRLKWLKFIFNANVSYTLILITNVSYHENKNTDVFWTVICEYLLMNIGLVVKCNDTRLPTAYHDGFEIRNELEQDCFEPQNTIQPL